MKALVTGAAGFIGSQLCEELLRRGATVRGVDCFTPYYAETVKWDNLAVLLADPEFSLVQADLSATDVGALLEDVDVVFHLAGQPGVRLSWADGFGVYTQHNVLATQRLLEAVRSHPVQRFVYASSSSVYGNAPAYPTHEHDLPAPHSPYGVTKLAGEHLCALYAANYGVPTTMLRYFTVYGPRQRPDMGLHRFIEAVLTGRAVPLFGTGGQVRDFTYVADVVSANIRAGEAHDLAPGTVLNVAGGGAITVNDLLALVGRLSGREVTIQRLPAQPGDVEVTGGSTARARELLGWEPRVDIETGVARQLAWHQSRQAVRGQVRRPVQVARQRQPQSVNVNEAWSDGGTEAFELAQPSGGMSA